MIEHSLILLVPNFIVYIFIMLSFCYMIKCIFTQSFVIDRYTYLLTPLAALLCSVLDYFALENFSSLINIILTLYFVLRGGAGKWKRIKSSLEFFFFELIIIMVLLFNSISIIAPSRIEDILNEETTNPMYTNITLFLSFIFETILFIYSYFYVYKKKIFITLRRKDKFILFCCSIYNSILAMIIITQSNTHQDAFHIGISITIFIFIFTVPLLIINGAITRYYKEGKEYQDHWLALELKHFEEYKQNQEETNRFRHDIKNHLLCLDTILKENKYEDAKNYLSDLVDEVKELSPRVVSGNELLDCILQIKWDTMIEKGITFSLDGVLDQGLYWQPMDICAVFSNALDNAIEACEKIQQPKEISMNIRFTRSYYYITIENTIANDTELTGIHHKHFTTKKDAYRHGYGLENIRHIIESYDGTMKIEIKNTKFVLELVVPAIEKP